MSFGFLVDDADVGRRESRPCQDTRLLSQKTEPQPENETPPEVCIFYLYGRIDVHIIFYNFLWFHFLLGVASEGLG